MATPLSAVLIAVALSASAPAFAQDSDAISTAPAPSTTPSPSAASAAAARPASPAASAAAPSSANQDVGKQIADYLASSPVVKLPPDQASGVVSGGEEPDRKVHGVASVSVGSHGYRNVYLRSDMPLGKTGELSISIQDGRGRGPYGYGYGYGGYGYGGYGGYGWRGGERRSLGLGFAFGDGVGRSSSSWREHCPGWRYGDPAPPAAADADCKSVGRAPDL